MEYLALGSYMVGPADGWMCSDPGHTLLSVLHGLAGGPDAGARIGNRWPMA